MHRDLRVFWRLFMQFILGLVLLSAKNRNPLPPDRLVGSRAKGRDMGGSIFSPSEDVCFSTTMHGSSASSQETTFGAIAVARCAMVVPPWIFEENLPCNFGRKSSRTTPTE